MGSISVPLSSEDEATLHHLAAVRHASDTEIAAAGLREYLHFEAEQIAKIQAGIAAADRGEFAGDAEVNAFFTKYGEPD